jgi:hypothetical protein
MIDGYKIRVFLNGVQCSASTTADPEAGTIEIIHNGAKPVILRGHVEIRLELDNGGKGCPPSSRL